MGDKDLVIAKRFDKDGDGILNATEREEAMNSLRNGYENQFIWGIEQTGALSNLRILQKRG